MVNIRRKKTSAIIAIIVIIILIIAALGYSFPDLFSEMMVPHNIELEETEAVSGTPFELHITTKLDNGRITFQDNIMVEHEGIFRNITHYDIKAQQTTVTVLIPPTVSTLLIEIESGHNIETFELPVRNTGTPLVSGQSFYDHESTMARRFNNRNVGTPMMQRASEFYQSYFGSLGYDSEIRKYSKTSGYRTYDVLDVVAFKWGQEYTNEWIVIGGHYDIVRRSIEGAYDNAAGACAVLELAEGFASLTTARTLVFCLWDGEEEGLWGSNFFAQDIPPTVDVKAYLNFDMVGLNWPLPYELLVLVGPDEDPASDDCPDLLNIARNATYNYLGYPADGVDIHESSGGGSDHLSFQKIGTQTYFFYGNSPYIQYHRRTDLLVDMVAYAGSRADLEQGFETVAWIAFYITMLIDNNDTLHQERPEE